MPVLAPHHQLAIDGVRAGAGTLINNALSANIPGLGWQEVLTYLIQYGTPIVLEWVKHWYEEWLANRPLPSPLPPPVGNPPPPAVAQPLPS